MPSPSTPSEIGSAGKSPTRTRRSSVAVAIAAGLTLAACGGTSVGAEDVAVPEQLALEDQTTTTAEETTTTQAQDEPTDTEVADSPEVSGEESPDEPTAGAESPAPADPAPADPAPAAPAEPTPAEPTPPAEVEPATDADDRSFQLLNEVRASKGLAPLVRDATMDEFARSWSAQMGATGNFEHSSASYGENIAFASDTSQPGTWAAETFNDNWINSPGHYANMTNVDYTTIGVGIVLTANGWYATHVFK